MSTIRCLDCNGAGGWEQTPPRIMMPGIGRLISDEPAMWKICQRCFGRRTIEVDEEDQAIPQFHLNKPPVGLLPRLLHDEKRLQDILDACERRSVDGLESPKEWTEEANELITRMVISKLSPEGRQVLKEFTLLYDKINSNVQS